MACICGGIMELGIVGMIVAASALITRIYNAIRR
jgi:hypothetical protein